MISNEEKQPVSCAPMYILQNLEGINKDADKIEYISDTLERCSIAPTPKRKKRKMSGYNCFTKVQYKKEKQSAEQENRKPISFYKMIKARAWSQLEDKSKGHWKSLANEGCPPRLWGV